jgi:hypothetical protein
MRRKIFDVNINTKINDRCTNCYFTRKYQRRDIDESIYYKTTKKRKNYYVLFLINLLLKIIHYTGGLHSEKSD